MPSPDYTVALHIGAHKTATSHLQESLLQAADALTEAGVQYYGPEHFRLPGRTLAALFGLRKNRRNCRPPADQLTLLRKGATRLALSEENFIGVLTTPRKRRVQKRYPDAGLRIAKLARTMDCGGLDVLVGIRHPATYLNSAYGQVLMGGHRMPITQFLKMNPVSSVDWLNLVQRIRARPEVNTLTVWKYEDYADVFEQITAAFVGPDRADLVSPLPDRVHVGLSAAAVARLHATDMGPERKHQANLIRRAMPAGPEYPAYWGIPDRVHAKAEAAYNAQIAAICALDGVNFLRPAGAVSAVT